MSELIVEDNNVLRLICGSNDSNIPYLEELTGCRISLKGNRILFSGTESRTEELRQLLLHLCNLSGLMKEIGRQDILLEYKALMSAENGGDCMISIGNRTITPKSSVQKKYIRSMMTGQIVFSIGPAGTGKTFLATNFCLSELLAGRKKKIVITRPVVEAGENLGFLPGDLSQKLNPYLKPLYDSMESCLSSVTVRRLEDNGQIEIVPLAYMRGRSLNNCCVILDEAQNTTVGQMKMFLTRIGENSTAVITGDITQTDLPSGQKSGLIDAMSRLRDIEGIDFILFNEEDIIRSRMVQRIVNAYRK